MKNYENFDNSFFIKIICIIAAIALLFVIVISVVGLLSDDGIKVPDDSSAETFVFSDIATGTETEMADTTPFTLPVTDAQTTPSAPDSEAEPVSSGEPTPTVLGETDDMGDEYIRKMIFVGDSTTYGLQAYKMLADGKNTKQVWTSSSKSLSLKEILTKTIVYPQTGKEMTISEAAELAKPEYMVITLGVEGVTSLDEFDFKDQYTQLVNAVKTASPATKIILQSIFPVASSFTDSDKLNNRKIDAANEWVKSVASETGVKYLDTQSTLKVDGSLNSDYDNGGNGINLNDRGFTAVLKYIRTHGYVG